MDLQLPIFACVFGAVCLVVYVMWQSVAASGGQGKLRDG